MAHRPRFYTEAQILLDFVVEYHKKNGTTPTLREGVKHFRDEPARSDGSGLGLRSLCTYAAHFDHLKERGCIRQVSHGSPRYIIARNSL